MWCCVTNKLIDHGADVNLMNDHEWSMLLSACYNNNSELAIKVLNKSNLDDIEKPNNKTFASVIDLIRKNKLTDVMNHLKFIYHQTLLQNIDNVDTVINKSCVKYNCDLNMLNIIIDFIY